MVAWYPATERRRSRTGLARRSVRAALHSSASASPYARPGGSTRPYQSAPGAIRGGGGGGGRRRPLSSAPYTGEVEIMSPLKGRALRLSYSHPHSGGGGIGPGAGLAGSEPLASAAGATGLSPPSSKSELVAAQETDNCDGRVVVDALTLQAIRIEVLDLLGSPPVAASVYSVAQAVGGCPQVRLLHANAAAEITPSEHDEHDEHGDGWGAHGGRYGDGGGEEEEAPAERSARRGAELAAALQSLVRRVGSVDRAVESWEEARAVLGSVLAFPGEHEKVGGRVGRLAEGSKEEDDGEDMDELEREQRDLEQEGTGGAFGIVPVLKNATPTTTPAAKRRSLAARVHRSTRRTLSKATTTAARSLSLAASRGQHHLTKSKYATMLRLANLEKMRKFKVLTSGVVPPPIPRSVVSLVQEEDEGKTSREDVDAEARAKAAAAEAARARAAAAMAALTGIAKFDHLADQRLSAAEATSRFALEAARQDAAIAAREQAEAAAIAAAEAAAAAQANRSATLLRDLTDDEAATVREAIYGVGRPDEIVATSDTDSVQRQSLHKLQPGVWLNDEVIHYFLLMLARRDEELAARADGGGGGGQKRKRCHFFKSFFITKLLDEAGGYNYKNVKRWSRKVPGKDIFALDKIFFPGKF